MSVENVFVEHAIQHLFLESWTLDTFSEDWRGKENVDNSSFRMPEKSHMLYATYSMYSTMCIGGETSWNIQVD